MQAQGIAPDSVYAEYTAEEIAISDRMEGESNHRQATVLEVRDEHEGHTVRGCADDSLRRLAKTYRRDLEDIEDGDLPDSSTGYRARMLKAKLTDIEREQEVRAVLAETWQAAESGTHCFTAYAGRGGLGAVINHGATPPSYELAVKLDWRNWKQEKPHVIDWSEGAESS